ncbi:NADH dehydrogenase subunit 5 [Iris pallida]|uniref:NADH dehydrogenase subunit 5 (Plastid) n=1 Tax=Iris pallida TaxID=29817 RepID=A0AAX6FSF6_IRIPA|nr:NADH dehydrogenase subunit 5 [Iris pallida]
MFHKKQIFILFLIIISDSPIFISLKRTIINQQYIYII